MLSWIPLLGPIIQGVSSIFTSFSNVDIAKIKEVQVETTTAAQIIHDTNDDIALKIMRDLVCFPVVVWAFLIGWDTITVEWWQEVFIPIPQYPQSVGYLPYAVLIFLLGNIGINTWNRR